MFLYANELTPFETDRSRELLQTARILNIRECMIMYIHLRPSVSMKSDLNRVAVYHLWGYTYDLGDILWKLRCMVKCSRSTVI